MLDWSVPHCILCLRLIGIAWDYYDGNNFNNNKISEDMKATRISTPPTLFEMTGFCYFFGGVLVGPQFSIRRYQSLVDGTLQDKDIDRSSSIQAGLQRFFFGIVYLVLFVVFNFSFNKNHFLSEWFENISLLHRFWFFIWFYEVMYMKYLGLFLVSEGCCIITGLGYNGKTEEGKPKWDAVSNIRIISYETSYSIQQIIQSFHLQTSLWIVRYVYKRAKFLGNRILSLAIAQFFLAVWHGVQPGYFFLFFCQFMIIVFERSVLTIWELLQWKKVSEMPVYVQIIVKPLLYLWSHMLMGYGSAPLALLYLDKIHKVGMLTYYAPFIAITTWITIIYPYVVLPRLGSRKPLAKVN
ncbi:lysophospholipid acyltransferase 5-like [Actinia tenebrosa]|uniref:Lysophospholipid acyltransferase 5 n=1 Tax=Actinia tenebrosa TaxID=6105 RepID=A0A6P8H4C7_ACTTE|nr:lysophospholipid acyltransferase 5-like [Actinia tenebrosa]